VTAKKAEKSGPGGTVTNCIDCLVGTTFSSVSKIFILFVLLEFGNKESVKGSVRIFDVVFLFRFELLE